MNITLNVIQNLPELYFSLQEKYNKGVITSEEINVMNEIEEALQKIKKGKPLNRKWILKSTDSSLSADRSEVVEYFASVDKYAKTFQHTQDKEEAKVFSSYNAAIDYITENYGLLSYGFEPVVKE